MPLNDDYADPAMARAFRPAVPSLLGEVRGLRVLDACCGPGILATAAYPSRPSRRERGDGRARARARRRDVRSRRLRARDPLRRRPPRGVRRAAPRPAPVGALVLSVQHPTDDRLRHGGSYFDSVFVVDTWRLDGRGTWEIGFWREPLSALTVAATAPASSSSGSSVAVVARRRRS